MVRIYKRQRATTTGKSRTVFETADWTSGIRQSHRLTEPRATRWVQGWPDGLNLAPQRAKNFRTVLHKLLPSPSRAVTCSKAETRLATRVPSIAACEAAA